MRLCSALIIPVLCADAQSIPADYKAHFAATELTSPSRCPDALSILETVWSFRPVSPIIGHSALLAARCYIELGQARQGLVLLQRYAEYLPQPAGHLQLAKSAQAAGELKTAATAFQRVFYEFPLSDQAAEAGAALAGLSNAPPVSPKAVFERAEKLRRGGRASDAKRELLAASTKFKGLSREIAAVRAQTGERLALARLRVTHPEADAERLYLLHAASRRSSAFTQAQSALEALESKYPKSQWTVEALTSWGNHYLLRNEVGSFKRLYVRCADRSAYCHWKLAWSAWMHRESGARKMLEEHITRFPDSDKVGAALYFLGRHQALVSQYPLSFYSTLVKSEPKAGAAPDAQFTPDSVMKLRAARARSLEAAGYSDWADFELKFAARDYPYLAAMELADLHATRGSHDQGLRYIKSLAKGYLLMPLESAPQRFWKLAFPMPYAESVVSNSLARDIDPNLVAALIRQESEFNPRAVSRARAYGLTQVLPSTGRAISRQAGISYFRPSMLFEPDTNVRLGTYYLRTLLDANGGKWEQTLAAYNAGQSRVREWLSWYEYREPAEFIETIPFSETRNYVQIVLRNAEVYRRLYGSDWNALTAKR